jgi:cell division protease FtsH
MVVQFGMSPALGLASFDLKRSPYWPGELETQVPRVSEGTVREIDLEVKVILDKCFEMAKDIIQQKKDFIDLATLRLLNSETLDETQIYELWQQMEDPQSSQSIIPGEVPINV